MGTGVPESGSFHYRSEQGLPFSSWAKGYTGEFLIERTPCSTFEEALCARGCDHVREHGALLHDQRRGGRMEECEEAHHEDSIPRERDEVCAVCWRGHSKHRDSDECRQHDPSKDRGNMGLFSQRDSDSNALLHEDTRDRRRSCVARVQGLKYERCLKINVGPDASGDTCLTVTLRDHVVELAVQNVDKGAYRKLKTVFAECSSVVVNLRFPKDSWANLSSWFLVLSLRLPKDSWVNLRS